MFKTLNRFFSREATLELELSVRAFVHVFVRNAISKCQNQVSKSSVKIKRQNQASKSSVTRMEVVNGADEADQNKSRLEDMYKILRIIVSGHLLPP